MSVNLFKNFSSDIRICNSIQHFKFLLIGKNDCGKSLAVKLALFGYDVISENICDFRKAFTAFFNNKSCYFVSINNSKSVFGKCF